MCGCLSYERMEGAGKGAEVRTHVRELLEVVGLQRVAATHVAVVDVGAGETGDRRLHQAEQSRAEQSREEQYQYQYRVSLR